MEKIKQLFHHFFIPSETNNYRSKAIQHDFLSYYLILALFLTVLVKNLPLSLTNVLGFATDISANKLFELTNKERGKNSLTILKYNEKLATAAHDKAKDMFAKNYWSHYAPDGKTPWDFILNNNYQYEYAGENLAKNFLFSQAVVDAWMNSPTHKENILKSNYSEVGFAIVNGVLNGEETTLVVQMFGKPLDSGQTATIEKAPLIKTVSAKEIVGNTKSTVLAKEVKPKINLSTFSFDATYVFIVFLLIALVLDFYFASKMNIIRFNGKNLAHFVFLLFLIISITLIIAKSGAVL